MLQINLNSKIVNEAAPVVAKPARPVSVAWMLGASDAESSRPVFCPEAFFSRRCYQIEYAFGYESVLGVSEITSQFTGSINWSKS